MTTRELAPFPFNVTLTSTALAYVMENSWQPVTGVASVDCLLDVQNLYFTGGATPGVALRPAIQYAAVRADRPDAPFQVSGSDVTTAVPAHYRESLSAATKLLFRRGVSACLTGSATFGRAQGVLYTAFRPLGVTLPTEEIVMQPFNASTGDVAVFPLGGGRPNPANEIGAVKLAVVGMGSAQGTVTLQPMVRFYNDLLARGDWTLVGSSNAPGTTNFAYNTGEVGFGSITPSDYQWFDVALAVWKSSGSNSRLVARVTTVLKYA